LPDHQAAAVQQVAQRHHEQQRQRAAQLSGRHDDAHRRLGHAELAADGVQQGLRVIHIGHAQGAGDRQQQDQRTRRAGGGPGNGKVGRDRHDGLLFGFITKPEY
jgi:hypothetical protein